MSGHGSFVQDIARAIDFGRIWIHLILDLSFRDVGEDRPRMLLRCRKRRAGSQDNGTQSPFTIGDFRRFLKKRFDCGICLPGVSHFENDYLRWVCDAEVPEHAVDMHGRFVENIARVVQLRRVGINLVLDVSFEDVGEDRAFVCVRTSGQSWADWEDEDAHLRIDCAAQRLLQQCFRGNGRWRGRRLREQDRSEEKSGEREDFRKHGGLSMGNNARFDQSTACTVPWIPCITPAIPESPLAVFRDNRG